MKEDIIIHPTRGKRERQLPETGFYLVTPREAEFAQQLLVEEGGREQFLYNSNVAVADGEAFFAAGPAIGAPQAVLTLEKLIALGASRIVMFGWCGAVDNNLKVGDIVLGGVPVSGEGTSRYYPTDVPPLPSPALTDELAQALSSAGYVHTTCNVWSTDAPYREDRIYLDQLHQNADVKCVDMEYSALCAVASFRGIDFAGLFLVSDELYREQWQPGYNSREFREKSYDMVRLLLDMS